KRIEANCPRVAVACRTTTAGRGGDAGYGLGRIDVEGLHAGRRGKLDDSLAEQSGGNRSLVSCEVGKTAALGVGKEECLSSQGRPGSQRAADRAAKPVLVRRR